MQTYLLTWTVSDLESISKSSSAGRVFQRVLSRQEAILNGQADFSLETGVRVFEIQQKFFDVKFGLPKLDQMAIPFEQAAGMEHWGMITYRENLLLFDPLQSSREAMHRIVKVISHEMAHQFFGNLVSVTFWEYTWMKEGFATLYEYYFVDILHPELLEFDFFFTEGLLESLIYDSSPFVTAMTHYRESPQEIPSSFSFVSYQKCKPTCALIFKKS